MRRILVADDHPMCAIAVRHAAHNVDVAIQVIAAGTLADAERALEDGAWDLVMLDLMLPDSHGLAGLASVRQRRPDVPIAILSSREEGDLVRGAMRLGARGYLGKAAPLEQLSRALGVLMQGGQWFPDGAVAGDADDEDGAATRLASLSGAQLRVLRAIADGHQNKQIAFDLGLSEATVKSHLAAIFRKLGVTNRTQAVLTLRGERGAE